MKAARFYGHKDVRVEETEIGPIPEGFVRIKVAWAGICGTDRHEYTGPLWISMDKPHRITGQTIPITLGHEFSGVIVALGEGVSGWQVGDRITASGNIYCGECDLCKSGRVNLCENLAFAGVGRDGAFAEYVNIPAYQLFKVPDNVSLERAVLTEPLACGWHATKLMGDISGKNVAVVGPGIIGMSAVVAARAAGANEIMLVGFSTEHAETALKVGATLYVDSKVQDPVAEGQKLTGKPGFDVVYECVGVQGSLDTACSLIRKGGKLMVMGVFEKKPVFDMNIFQEGERVLYSSQAYVDELADVLKMMESTDLPLEGLITSRIPLENIVPDGFEHLLNNPGKDIKVAICINDFEQ